MDTKNISIIIPVWNEAPNIRPLVLALDRALKKSGVVYELIFIDDYSTDNTREILKSLSSHYPIVCALKNGPRGKAHSLIEGFALTKYDNLGIIDGDLQYPPKAIPPMLAKLGKEVDIVVAERSKYQDGVLRRVLSQSFKTIFGHFLFGLNHDVQAGLKVFKKEVLGLVKFQPSSGWTFDLEFLHRAREAGFKIANYNIVFRPRFQGKTKVDHLKTTWELGAHALRLRFKHLPPLRIPPVNPETMLGAGLRWKRKQYVTHTTLPHHQSAIRTLSFEQKFFFILLLLSVLAGFILKPLPTAVVLVGILSFIYFVDVLFNFFLVIKSLHFPQEITFSDKKLASIGENSLPLYSILCPLYHEANILPQFLAAMEKLDWPKEKLELLLLLEEDDWETIEAVNEANLPFYARKIIVPHSLPKTKPKACNFGLSHAKGEYVVIYDAEDIPEPLQLKKAYLGFAKTGKKIVCLQAKLNYYNPHQNLLTRLFAAEYSLWFDITLPGLQSLKTTIPLGGTSNHFRRKDLLKLQGWDPFNVTEDADLGVRLFKEGYQTAMIDSVTLEEAASKLSSWLKQRSRWLKGYMQTYLVHLRQQTTFTAKMRFHSLIFQLVIGGKIAFILINPFLWLATIAYFALYPLVGPTIEALYPPPIFYMALVSLVFGNFLFFYCYMIGVIKRQEWSLVKYVYLVPVYWLAMSVACTVALWQLLFKPHFWEKTVHGLHLKPSRRRIIPEIVIKVEGEAGLIFPVSFKNKLATLVNTRKKYFSGLVLITAVVLSNFLNFAFNAYLGRTISLDNFALVNLVGALLSLSSIPFGAFTTTINYRTGFLIGRFKNEEHAYSFWRYMRSRPLTISLVITLIWLISTPFWQNYFRTDDVFLFILFGLVLLTRFTASADRGFLSARLMFISLAAVTIFEPTLKLAFAYLFVELKTPQLTYTAIPLSFIGAFLFGWFLVTKKQVVTKNLAQQTGEKHFPKKFFFVSVLSGLSTMAFLSLDILLAKHFLSPEDAGRYALISLAGKMIYFMGSLSSQFVTPLISRSEGAKKSSQKTFSLILLATVFLSVLGFTIFGLAGSFTIPLLYGPKATSIIPYLIPFALAMMCFTISKVFVSYYLTKRIYSFAIGAFALSIAQFILINRYHASLDSIVSAMLTVGVMNFALMLIFHLRKEWIKVFERNFADSLNLFFKREKAQRVSKEKLRILIFNWRDIKHKWAGGAEVYIHEIAKRWVQKGNEVTLFCGNDGKNPRQEKIDGIEIIRRGGFCFVYVWAFLYYILRFHGKFDVIIDCENGIPFFTPLYAWEKKYLVIHHVHQEVFMKSLPKPLAFFASFLEMKLMPFVYRRIQIITVSPSSRKAILENKLTQLEPIIIYSGVDLETYRPAVKSPMPLVLYLGRLKYYKSLDVLIRAAKEVLAKIPEVRFVIAGDGEQKQGLINLVKKLSLEDKITFLGKVSEAEKIRLYQKAWVFVNPSLIEGWGITTIEANACGTPAVASDVSGLRDSINNPHTGILVNYGDCEAFAESVIKLIDDKKLRKEISKEAINWANNFSWEKSATEFYSHVLSKVGAKDESVEKVLINT